VSDEQVRWSAPYTGYAPPTWTHKAVADNARGLPTGQGWADPDDPIALRDELRARTTFTTEGGVACSMGEALRWDAQSGAPLNPCGRTGLAGRGLLGKWGANHAADPIVTRFDPESGRLQVVAIQRRDTKQWALPGGMVDPGEAVSVTVQREFSEEAGELTDPAERLRFEQLTKELFGSGKQVYRGYVDDPRNSDNAWMETTAFHFHCSDEIGRMLPLEAGDDAQRVRRPPATPASPLLSHPAACSSDTSSPETRPLDASGDVARRLPRE
jgi:ADP-ribose pyrophosphatase